MAPFTERDQCAHLLRRFGLGASEAELDFYMRDGFNGAVDRLLDDSADDGFSLDPDRLDNAKGQLPMPVAVDWWIMRMLTTQRPLREKMTLFWHNHFATSADKVNAPRIMIAQNELLRKNATGNFKALLSDVSKDPAMILWLDNRENVKGHANENFAREVMELFTLGIGHYTETDVKEAARAFTGWSLRRQGGAKKGTAEFLYRPGQHDDGSKTFLGSSGNFNGDDILAFLCSQTQTSEYIVSKLWDWFVWPKPDAATTAPFAKRFRESGMDIKALLKDVMRSSEFYSPKALRSVMKNPVDFCIATMRQLGVGEIASKRLASLTTDVTVPRVILAPAQAAQTSMKSMGMALMFPPDVSGWRTGNYWITSATMVERMSWGDRVFGQAKVGKIQLRYPAYALLSKDPTPEGVVRQLVGLFDAPLKSEKIQVLGKLAAKAMTEPLSPTTAPAVAAQVSRLIFATPEFQFA